MPSVTNSNRSQHFNSFDVRNHCSALARGPLPNRVSCFANEQCAFNTTVHLTSWGFVGWCGWSGCGEEQGAKRREKTRHKRRKKMVPWKSPVACAAKCVFVVREKNENKKSTKASHTLRVHRKTTFRHFVFFSWVCLVFFLGRVGRQPQIRTLN